VILCGLLIAFSGTVQIAHSHDSTGTSHADCSLCLVAHASIAPSAPAAVVVAIEHTASIEILRAEAPSVSFVFCYHTRPPPPAESVSL